MNIEDFYRMEGARLSFTRQQGSDFAKRVAGDFNPIHHPDSKRFCVPGDLLFSVIVHHYGLRQNMAFRFSGMVDDSVQLLLPECEEEHTEIAGDNGKTFPDTLIPLLKDHGVMINPDRPLVIYDRMSFQLDRIDIEQLDLRLADAQLKHSGKRGEVTLEYDLLDQGERVGHGCKHMALGGIRPYQQDDVDRLVQAYEGYKREYSE